MEQRQIHSVDGSSDSEDDSVEHAPNQALPIANLPFNFNGIPQDGMEYLFTNTKVIEMSFTDDPIINYRRDSRLLPRFTRVDHPATNAAEPPLTEEEPTKRTLHRAFPTEEWRIEYVQHFLNYRQNLQRALDAPNAPGRPAPAKVQLPNWQNRNEWWHFITGSPRKGHKTLGKGNVTKNSVDVVEAVDSERDTNGAHEPTLSMLKQFSLRNVTSLLYWFSVWITAYTDSLEDSGVQSSGDENGERSGPAATTTTTDARFIEGIHQRWMFALLGMLDSQIMGNDISTLRVLARAAIRLVQLLTKDDITFAQEGGYVLGTADPEGVVVAREASPIAAKDGRGGGGAQSTIAGCWMVVTAIVGVWGQRDIWDEARDALSTSR